MDFLEGSNRQCLSKCVEKLKIDNDVVFETTFIQYCEGIEHEITILKFHKSISSCQVSFIRSTEYGEIYICTE